MEETEQQIEEVEQPEVESPEDGDATVSQRSIPGGPNTSQSSIASREMDPKGDDEAAAIEGELDKLVKTAAERDEYLALAQRTQADFENYRKRVARDAAQAQDRGVAKLAKELLPALDNLDRAIEAATLEGAPSGEHSEGHTLKGIGKQAGEAEDPLLAGVRLVRSELAAALTRVGIEAFAPLGEPFDPNQQEAMAQQPIEGAASGTVAEVYQDGYRMGETIIRPARVLVAA
jgi:molecular chaperone GrpE